MEPAGVLKREASDVIEDIKAPENMFVEPNHELLTTKLPTFDFSEPAIDPVELAHILVREMNSKNGYGLSANQIGLPYRAFAMRGSPNLVCINPRIVWSSDETNEMEEGCLSFPNLIFKARRKNAIRVRFATPNGQVITRDFNGLTSRIFQHEMDHMEGRLPFAGIGRLKLDRALKDAEKRGSYYRPYGVMKHA